MSKLIKLASANLYFSEETMDKIMKEENGIITLRRQVKRMEEKVRDEKDVKNIITFSLLMSI